MNQFSVVYKDYVVLFNQFFLFFCHLAMEKFLKAVYVKIKDDFAPKTHNLLYLCELCGIELTEEQMTFYAILMKYQITGRYPDNTGHRTRLISKKCLF